MRRVTIEQTLSESLSASSEQVVLCDAAGRALGFFSPLEAPTPVDELNLAPPLSIAEIDELRKNPTGKPLEEILARLGLS